MAEEDGCGGGFGDVREELLLVKYILRDGWCEQDESQIVECFGRWWQDED